MNNETETFDPIAANAAQVKYCNETKSPHFAPTGSCYDCHKNIYEQIDHGTYKTGISVERAGRGLITGCPHCCHSYCD
jgi:hypothetical protein